MVKIVIQVRFSLHPVEVNSCFADLPNVFAPHPKIPFINSTDISEIEISKSITILWMTCQKHVLNLHSNWKVPKIILQGHSPAPT